MSNTIAAIVIISVIRQIITTATVQRIGVGHLLPHHRIERPPCRSHTSRIQQRLDADLDLLLLRGGKFVIPLFARSGGRVGVLSVAGGGGTEGALNVNARGNTENIDIVVVFLFILGVNFVAVVVIHILWLLLQFWIPQLLLLDSPSNKKNIQ